MLMFETSEDEIKALQRDKNLILRILHNTSNSTAMIDDDIYDKMEVPKENFDAAIKSLYADRKVSVCIICREGIITTRFWINPWARQIVNSFTTTRNRGY